MFTDFPSNTISNYRYVSECVDRYELALIENMHEELDAYLPAQDSSAYLTVLAELARIRLEWDWKHGKQDGLESLLCKYHQIVSTPEVLVEVAFEDYRLRSIYGCRYSPKYYRDKYRIDTSAWPNYSPSVGIEDDWHSARRKSVDGESVRGLSQGSSLLEPQGVEAGLATQPARPGSTDPMDSAPRFGGVNDQIQFPVTGSEFGGFRIIRELGRGTFSRVYLARQSDLAQRNVVLKVTATPMGESQRLARLQHANIMPLYSVHRVDGLFGLCMPFLGAITLKEVLQELRSDDGSANPSLIPSSGKIITQAIERSANGIEFLSSFDDSKIGHHRWLGSQYEKQTYVDAVLTIVLRLSEGLAHAHQRGIHHHDIKPANVLLAFDGEPLLMDFNLGRDSRNALSASRRIVGGTLPYMAPEHLRAMQLSDVELTPGVDVFSIGVLLYELLTGVLPFYNDEGLDADVTALVQKRELPIKLPSFYNELVPPSIDAIVEKCLNPKLSERYPGPEELATDIRLHLSHCPNRHASNPSAAERVKMFARRHPMLISNASMLTVATVLLGTLTYGLLMARHEKLSLQAVKTYQQFQVALHTAEAELLFPDGGSHQSGLQAAEDALAIYSTSLSDLAEGTEARWQRSSLVNKLPQQDQKSLYGQISQLNALAQSALAADGLEGLPLSSPDTGEMEVDEDVSIEPFREAIEHYHSREYQNALQLLDAELERYPNRFALWFVQGNCYFQLGKYRQAEHAYAMASWIDPDSALCQLKRAVCYYQLMQDEAAFEHLDKAESIAPGISAIYSNRCLLFERQQKFEQALQEINQAIGLQPNCARFLMMRSRVYRGLRQTEEAAADLRLVRDLVPDNPDDWITKGIAVLSESPEESIACFRRACAWPGGAITARQNIAHVLSERMGKAAEAICELDELLKAYPKFLPALSGRAVLHARLGHVDLALQDVEQCLKLDPAPETHYQIACVYSLLSEKDTSFRQSALSHLAVSLQPLYQHQMIASDSDLKPLEEIESFQAMKSGIQAVMENRMPSQDTELLSK